jgi:hypothetical protein
MRHTGPGRVIDNINPQVSAGGRYDLWKFLANFDIDGDALKIEHTNWLDASLIRRDNSQRGRWVFLRGWASRTGDPGHNDRLSLRRVDNVRGYLLRYGFSLTHITGSDYVGELWSNDGPDENWQQRAVEVIVSPDRLYPPPPPHSHVIELDATAITGRLSRHFKIRVLGSLQLGAAAAGNGIVFEIWDTTYGLACRYLYFGLGAGLSIPGGPHALETLEQLAKPVEVGMSLAGRSGNWHYFSTRAHVEVDNFAGPRCSFVEVSIGGRDRPPGATQEEWQETLGGRVDQFLFTPYFEFTADPFGPAHQNLSVRVDIPSGILSGLPSALLTGGPMTKIWGPYARREP